MSSPRVGMRLPLTFTSPRLRRTQPVRGEEFMRCRFPLTTIRRINPTATFGRGYNPSPTFIAGFFAEFTREQREGLRMTIIALVNLAGLVLKYKATEGINLLLG